MRQESGIGCRSVHAQAKGGGGRALAKSGHKGKIIKSPKKAGA